jgi:general secretion pathway protein B
MSLILEALKKSEAERLRGRAPGLLDLQPRAPRRRGRIWPMALAATLTLGAAGGGYLWLQGTPSAGTPRTEGVSTSPARASAAAEPNAEALMQAQTYRGPEPGSSAVPAAVEPASPPPASRLPSDPGFASVEREARPQLAVRLPPPAPAAPVPASPEVAPVPAQPTAVATADAATAPVNSATKVVPPVESTQAPPATEPIDAAATAAPPADTLPPLASLGHEARGRLPPLKVSMHVFAEDPAARVVIIDGRRLREGDAIDSTLRLAEIRREGSVLELEGRRYLLPRP